MKQALATDKGERKLRTGYTTGACAAAAAKAALLALLTGRLPDKVRIMLPGGERPVFALAHTVRGEAEGGTSWAEAGIVKDAGDDPDVTHGALIITRVRPLPQGSGLVFRAGEGVGTVTLPGLPLSVGEPAINPGPRLMIREALQEAVEEAAKKAPGTGSMPNFSAEDLEITVSIPGGEELAKKTMNARLGIVGGLSVLGTSGIVRPYSCAAWVASIREGVDVARALGLEHIVGATGRTSEEAARERFGLPEQALIDMGDFAGGLLKYVRTHPVPRLTIAGGPAKLAKLGQGMLDLHSKRGRVNMAELAEWLPEYVPEEVRWAVAQAHSVAAAIAAAERAGIDLPAIIARRALATMRAVLRDAPVRVDVLVVARDGRVLAEATEPDHGGA